MEGKRHPPRDNRGHRLIASLRSARLAGYGHSNRGRFADPAAPAQPIYAGA